MRVFFYFLFNCLLTLLIFRAFTPSRFTPRTLLSLIPRYSLNIHLKIFLNLYSHYSIQPPSRFPASSLIVQSTAPVRSANRWLRRLREFLPPVVLAITQLTLWILTIIRVVLCEPFFASHSQPHRLEWGKPCDCSTQLTSLAFRARYNAGS